MGKRLPIAVVLLWGRRREGSRGPQPTRSIDEIVDAAVQVADVEGLEAVTMARVARELGFTTMALYRYVPNKDVLLQLMWNAGAEVFAQAELDEGDWRSQLRSWAMIQRESVEKHPWIARMPIGYPPLAPNALRWLEKGLEAFADTAVPHGERLQVLGMISAYGLADVRLGAELRDGARAAAEEGIDLGYGGMLRELVDADEFPRLHELAWSGQVDDSVPTDDLADYAADLEIILDGVAALVARFESAGS